MPTPAVQRHASARSVHAARGLVFAWAVALAACSGDEAVEGLGDAGQDAAADGALANTDGGVGGDGVVADGAGSTDAAIDDSAEVGATDTIAPLDGQDPDGAGLGDGDGSPEADSNPADADDASADADGGPATGALCSDCAKDSDCPGSSCALTVDGPHCLPLCKDDGACVTLGLAPGKFACLDTPRVSGGSNMVCAPVPGFDPPAWAKGSCGCPGAQASAESCNGLDDDCDGKSDEGLCPDDGNACTNDLCDSKGKCGHPSTSSFCDDGEPCTSGEACQKGQCTGGKPPLCEDDNPCTADSCAKGKGCVHTPKDGTCNAQGAGGATGSCQIGVCQQGTCALSAVGDCSDGNPCTADSCDKDKGECSHAKAADGSACDDGDACTGNDACKSASCQGKATNCGDGNPCTTDACDPSLGCNHEPALGAACDDGDKCTVGDSCKAGGCSAGPPKSCEGSGPCAITACEPTTGACAATGVGVGATCDDGNACTVSDGCLAGSCLGKPKSCDDADVCTTDACDPKTGCASTQALSPDGKPLACDDGNACSLGDACGDKGCSGTQVTCDDGNPCTKDACDLAQGCTAVALDAGAGCDDGDACTGADACKAGVCAGTAVGCDDGNACTVDACLAGKGCVQGAGQGACDDGNACTTSDACSDSACKGKDVTTSCNDGNPCTDDACKPAAGCVAAASADGKVCDDGNACSVGDNCQAGVCKAAKLVCECKVNGDCVGKGGNPCLGALACVAGACAVDAATAVTCTDSGNACTNEACDPKTGACAVLAQPDGKPCDADGSPCTSNDACKAGTCSPGAKLACDDGNPCTLDGCDSAKGCVTTPAKGECVDGNPCTLGDVCDGGTCKSGAAKLCDDGKACTSDACDKLDGSCQHKSLSGPCDDGDACTGGDACKDGACVAGTSLVCDDKSDCTTDSCVSQGQGAGCKHVSKTGPCSDGDACTSGDACQAGVCAPTGQKSCPAKDCHTVSCDPAKGECKYAPIFGCGGLCLQDSDCPDDDNPCTSHACHAAAGKCVHNKLADKSPCQDGLLCSEGDVCAGGKCSAGKPKSCDDGNICTADACNEALNGCAFVAKPGPCNDGDACTTNDGCQAGKCQAGAPKVCNDWNPCTADSCDQKAGECKFTKDPNCSGKCATDADCPKSQAACQLNICNAGKTCQTVAEKNNTKCDDGSACTGLDLCLSAKCVGYNAKVCDDGNPCTADGCDKKSGACASAPTSDPCQDGDLCTSSDVCEAGKCVPGKPKDCNDGNKCTTDSCNASNGACAFAPIVGCGGNCTENKHCGDDGNPCTVEACNTQTGKCSATKKADNTLCDDQNACSAVSFCKNGVCGGANLKACKDDDVCTDDGCDKKSGDCTFTAKTGGGCLDGSFCTSGDSCKAGKCVGIAKVCNDGNACTADSCTDSNGACVFTPIAGCGNFCAKDADCKDDGNPCTTHTCTLSTKTCAKAFADKSTACDDGNPCTTKDTCLYTNGVCYGGPAKSCDDSNPCTSDVCDPKTGGCSYIHNSSPCNDNDACTLNDKCSSGACKAGFAKTCIDGIACTTDTCDPKTGACSYPIKSDGGCCGKDGDCQDDGKPCTVAYCDALKSCKHKAGNDGQPCSDGNACSVGDACKGGSCGSGSKKSCDDGEVCTDDLCDPDSGQCFGVHNSKGCEDGDKCTGGSTCKAGKCPAGQPNVSCPTKTCHTVMCDPKTGGCVYTAIPDCK